MWKPRGLSVTNGSTYTIELSRWGITQGLPTKSSVIVGNNTFSVYADADYLIAKNNIAGINEALKYASDKGYKKVSLPYGEYSLCYGSYLDTNGGTYDLSIYPQKDTLIDFNNSTLKVIYDSDKLSPYHDRTIPDYNCPNCGKSVKIKEDGTCPTLADPIVGDCGIHIGFWRLSGFAIVVREPSVHIERLKLIGDRADRSFYSYYDCTENYPTKDVRSFSEAGIEWSVGINFANGSNGSSVTGSDIAFFMGDNVATYFQDNVTRVKYKSTVGVFEASQLWDMQFGGIDNVTGLAITGVTNEVRTKSLSIPVGVNSYSMIGLGFTPRTTIPNYKYNVYFYDSGNNFISRFSEARTVDIVYLPIKATSMRITFIGKGTLDDGASHAPYWMQLVSRGISSNILIARNKIRGGHRGGIFLGGNNVNIEYNELISNGSTSDLYGLVMFPYLTRYGINSEDNVGHNYKINNNVILKSRMGIAIRGEYAEISGNEFRHNDINLTLYRMFHANIEKNTFLGSTVNDYPYDELDFIRDWNISGNTFMNSSLNFTGKSPVTSIENNVFSDSGTSVACEVYNFSDNTFVATNSSKEVSVAGKNGIRNCSFIGNATYMITVKGNSILKDCYFNQSRVWFAPANYGAEVHGCKFINSSVELNNNTVSILSVKVYDSSFDYTISKNVVPHGATLGVNIGYSLEFHNCKFKGLATNAFGMQQINSLHLHDCELNWNVASAITNPLCVKHTYNVGKVIMTNCKLTSNIDITQDLTMFDNPCVLDFVDLDKFSFTTRITDNIQTGNMKDNLLQALADIKALKGT